MRFIELFAGIGLFRYGLESLGREWRCVFANDFSEMKARAYALNFETTEFQLKDVRQLYATDLPDAELLTASFPCQDLSIAGNRGGLKSQRSGTFYEVIRLLSELKQQERMPKTVILENVIGLLTVHKGKDIHTILEELNKLGYRVDLLLIDASHWLPQSRPRLFIVGRADTSNVNILSSEHVTRPLKIQRVIHDNPDLEWSFLNLPNIPNSLAQTLNELVQKEGVEWFSELEVEREMQYIRHASYKRLKTAQDATQRDGITRYLPGYRRMRQGEVCLELRDDGLAGCLRTPTGGSSRQLLVEVSAQTTAIRLMTPREYARLMGLPDNFKLPTNTREALYGCGDAVAVPVIQWLGQVINAKNVLVPHLAPAPPLFPV